MGSVAGEKVSASYSVNLLQTVFPSKASYLNEINKFEESGTKNGRFTPPRKRISKDEHERNALEPEIEGIYRTDFGDTLNNTSPRPSIKKKRALKMMEETAKNKKTYPPDLPNNRDVVVRRCELLKRRLFHQVLVDPRDCDVLDSCGGRVVLYTRN